MEIFNLFFNVFMFCLFCSIVANENPPHFMWIGGNNRINKYGISDTSIGSRYYAISVQLNSTSAVLIGGYGYSDSVSSRTGESNEIHLISFVNTTYLSVKLIRQHNLNSQNFVQEGTGFSYLNRFYPKSGGFGFAVNENEVVFGFGKYVNSYYSDIWMVNVKNGSELMWLKNISNVQSSIGGSLGVFESNNTPSGRWLNSVIKFDDDLVLFVGGYGYSAGLPYHLNDVFVYSISLNMFKWIAGSLLSSADGVAGVYGTRGIPSPTNCPSSRYGSASWFTRSTSYIFGGYGATSQIGSGTLNDLFSFNGTSYYFTWLLGDDYYSNTFSVVSSVGEYGSGNVLGGRLGMVSVLLSVEEVFLFGGNGLSFNKAFPSSSQADIWILNLTSLQYKFLGPADSFYSSASYGELGVFSSNNRIGRRQGGNGFSFGNSSGLVYLFGGSGYDSLDASGALNDFFLVGVYSCFSKSNLRFTEVCSGVGHCVSNDKCLFCNTSSSMLDCGFSCFGFSSQSDYRCFGHGNCLYEGKCDCFSSYSGDDCSQWSCGNISRFSPVVCGGKGICTSADHCSCDSKFGGDQCELIRCMGINSNNYSFVCGGNGICVSPDICECNLGSFGSECMDWGCFNITKSSTFVCGGKGKCVSSDVCECTDPDYQGPLCSYTGGFTLAIVSFIASSLVLSSLLIVIVIFIILIAYLCSFRKKLKKVEMLENIDILLEEQNAEKNSSIAHFNINKDFFKVKFSDVQLKKIIGEGGGDACVYLANWHSQEVAVKLFKLNLLDEKKYSVFENEVKIQSSLHHPNVLRFLGAILEEKKVGFIMELCKHGDLEHFLKLFSREHNEQKYSIVEKMRMLKEIASAMKYLHSLNVIHRDLKPQNVLITDNEETRVMDFGLSKLALGTELTQTVRVGTSVFMAPEVLSGYYDEKVDVFSFGIMMYVVLTEKWKPYGEEMSVNGVELRVKNNPDFRPNLSIYEVISHKEIICKMWDNDSKMRPSFDDIISYLEIQKGKIESSVNSQIVELQSVFSSFNFKMDSFLKMNTPFLKKFEYLNRDFVSNLKKFEELEKDLFCDH